MLKSLFMGAALFALAITGQASAASITFTATGTASGSIGQTVFDLAPYTITGMGDTANAELCQSPGPIPGCYVAPLTSTQISIGNLGSFAFTNTSAFFDNNYSGSIGFLDVSGPTYLNFFFYGLNAPAFFSYDAVSALSPTPFTAVPQGYVAGNSYPIQTSGGVLNFTAGSSPGIFQAVLGSNAVPEPASWLMMVLGFAVSGAAIRGRKKVRQLA